MTGQILNLISRMATPGFFVTAEFSGEDSEMPSGLEQFINEKLQMITQGVNVRKFVFRENKWRIVLTFFPTDKVVDEKYALKNKVSFKYK